MRSALIIHPTRAARPCPAASARPGAPVPSASKTSVPCICCSHRGSAGSPSAARRRRRFSATEPGSSPTPAARFRLAYGAALTPPERSVQAARTLAGALHSGASHSMLIGRRSRIVPQGREKRPKILRYWRLEGVMASRHRVIESQTLRMQRLAAKGRQRLLQSGAGSGHQPPPAAIERVTHDRKSRVREVHADLVRAAGLELHAQQGVAAETLLDPEV